MKNWLLRLRLWRLRRHVLYPFFLHCRIAAKSADLYLLAFTHASFHERNAAGAVNNYERLEFLGDAVLSTIIADYLFLHYPNSREGELSRLKSKFVSREHLNHLADCLGIASFIQHNLRSHAAGSLLGNVLEALIGALYLDKGYRATQEWVFDFCIQPFLADWEGRGQEPDYKSLLVSYCQKNKFQLRYEIIEQGIAHGHRYFRVGLVIQDQLKLACIASSKKKAEQELSRMFYLQLQSQ